jgi:hypothetical protein
MEDMDIASKLSLLEAFKPHLVSAYQPTKENASKTLLLSPKVVRNDQATVSKPPMAIEINKTPTQIIKEDK